MKTDGRLAPTSHRRADVDDADGSHDAERVFVVVNGTEASIAAVHLGRRLAIAYGTEWEAIFPETPARRAASYEAKAGDALSLAARLGAMVYRLPPATAADAVADQIRSCRSPHVVLTLAPRSLLQRARRSSLIDELIRRNQHIVFHGVAAGAETLASRAPAAAVPLRSYVLATAGSLLMLAAVLLLKLISGTGHLSLLFLFPVIATAARLGLRPALLAALVSSIGFNFLFLAPVSVFDPWAVQTWLMLAILGAVAAYTSWLTETLRGRIVLSDRTAQESATLAAFAQELTRAADWTETGRVVCREIHNLLGVKALIAREISGDIQLMGSDFQGAALDPLDSTALDWAWQHREPAGSGTPVLSEASWQFQPLVTSLGVLAVLGLAREDGRDPVPAERRVLLGTIVAQAALAHERLRLEDDMREASVQKPDRA